MNVHRPNSCSLMLLALAVQLVLLALLDCCTLQQGEPGTGVVFSASIGYLPFVNHATLNINSFSQKDGKQPFPNIKLNLQGVDPVCLQGDGCFSITGSSISISEKQIYLLIGNFTKTPSYQSCCTNYDIYTFSYADGKQLSLKSVLPFARSVIKPANWSHPTSQGLAFDDTTKLLFANIYPPGDRFDSYLYGVDYKYSGEVKQLAALSAWEPTFQSSALCTASSPSSYFFFDMLSRLYVMRLDGVYSEYGIDLGHTNFPYSYADMVADQTTGKLYLASNTFPFEDMTKFIAEIVPDLENFVNTQVRNTTVAYSSGMKFWANNGILYTVPNGGGTVRGYDVQSGKLLYTSPSPMSVAKQVAILFDYQMP